MHHPRILAALLVLFATVGIHAQTGISGIANNIIYTGSATFYITNEAGFSYDARLDDSPVSVGESMTVTKADYHELSVLRTNTGTVAVTSQLVKFIVRSPERGGTEDGLPPWVPYPPIPSAGGEFTGGALRLIAPESFPSGMPIPIVAWVEDANEQALRVNGTIIAPGQNPIKLVRGVGSGFLSDSNSPGTVNYQPAVGGLAAGKTINVETGTVWTGVAGTLGGSISWPANSRIAITNHLILAGGATLTIGAGTIVRVSPGVDITNNAAIIINGTREQPVIFTPISPAQPWGGFTMRTSEGSITGTDVIFTGSGAVPNWFGSGGNPSSHRKEQALFFCAGTNVVDLTDAAAISLAGQLGHAVAGGTFNLNRFLMQRTTTGGEFTGASFHVSDSAFIECPDDSVNFVDGDNDALYLWSGNHHFTRTLFGFTKDDGVDSGGEGAGVLNFTNCWFESAFHEGNSLSGTNKYINHHHSIFINCGQAIEAGYSAAAGDLGPTGTLYDCLSTANLTGARYGDNYNWNYEGYLRATHSIIIHNYRDVWGMDWTSWSYNSARMDIHSNSLTAADAIWPANTVWNPATEAARLAAFITGHAGSPVGIGFALRTNMLSTEELTNGIPVRLSRFSTNVVSVNYDLASNEGLLASGVLTFQPGETVKNINLVLPAPQNHEFLSLQLAQPVQAEITGLSRIFTVTPQLSMPPATLIAQGSAWHHLDSGANLGETWRALSFPDDTWTIGPAQLGFGDGDEVSLVASNRQVTTYFRHRFIVDDPVAFDSLTVALLRDDGGAVYLNGAEIFRSNLAQQATYTTLATNALAADETTLFYTNLVFSPVLLAGTNICAVEVHQSSATSSDLSFDLKLFGHYKTSTTLKHVSLGNSIALYWDNVQFTLEQADEVTGPWTPVSTGSNVFLIEPAAGKRFFRLKH